LGGHWGLAAWVLLGHLLCKLQRHVAIEERHISGEGTASSKEGTEKNLGANATLLAYLPYWRDVTSASE
jgi:hypothetical protein